jgi:hypothetical protein
VFTWTAIERAASVKQRRSVVHERAGHCQRLAGGTNVDIGSIVEAEVTGEQARELTEETFMPGFLLICNFIKRRTASRLNFPPLARASLS